MQQITSSVSSNIKDSISNYICRGLQRIEEIGNLTPGFGEFYDRVFYHKLLEAELKLAGLKAGDRVIHIGCGPRPMTAFYLARRGLMVTGVERDSGALNRAVLAVEQAGLKDRIKLKQGNGLAGDFSSFKAIWLSLHVDGKDSIIERIIKTASRETTIIYRNPAGFLSFFYPGEKPENFSNIKEYRHTGKILGKKSVLLKV